MAKKQSKATKMAARILALKLNRSFTVDTKSEQVAACTIGRKLLLDGQISVRITTRYNQAKDKFEVRAIEA